MLIWRVAQKCFSYRIFLVPSYNGIWARHLGWEHMLFFPQRLFYMETPVCTAWAQAASQQSLCGPMAALCFSETGRLSHWWWEFCAEGKHRRTKVSCSWSTFPPWVGHPCKGLCTGSGVLWAGLHVWGALCEPGEDCKWPSTVFHFPVEEVSQSQVPRGPSLHGKEASLTVDELMIFRWLRLTETRVSFPRSICVISSHRLFLGSFFYSSYRLDHVVYLQELS